MAKYTMLFKDFIESGGTYPVIFGEIEGLETAFFGRYCVSEIGFETPSIFQIKFEATANELVPLYKEKLALESAQYVGLLTPTKLETITHAYGQIHTNTEGRTTELPIDAETATPSGTNSSEGTTDARTDVDSHSIGISVVERLQVLEKLREIKKPIISELLDKFKTLFMGVY